jgi:proton glutamate symport protein
MNFLKKISLTHWIFISMVLGIIVGIAFPEFSQKLQLISKIFLRLIKTIVAPLIFATIVLGIAHHSKLKDIGKLGLKSIIYFEVVTTLALFIGLGAINLTQAGKGIHMQAEAKVIEKVEETKQIKPKSFGEYILDIFPENITKAITEGKVLQIVIFSILFGLGVSMAPAGAKNTMIHFADGLAETMFKVTHIIMYFAPVAVGAAMAYAVGHMGISVLLPLLKLVGTLYGALAALILFVLIPIGLYFKINLKKLWHHIKEPVSIAFATTSSDAALPKLFKALEDFGCSRKIVSFVLPMGYSFNLDGTTLYLSLATVFVAQASGIELTLMQQLSMLFILMLTSKGVAAVPRASLVILIATASDLNLPIAPIYLIFGVDELMDMARTSTNVIGNSLATCVIAKSEGELKEL